MSSGNFNNNNDDAAGGAPPPPTAATANDNNPYLQFAAMSKQQAQQQQQNQATPSSGTTRSIPAQQPAHRQGPQQQQQNTIQVPIQQADPTIMKPKISDAAVVPLRVITCNVLFEDFYVKYASTRTLFPAQQRKAAFERAMRLPPLCDADVIFFQEFAFEQIAVVRSFGFEVLLSETNRSPQQTSYVASAYRRSQFFFPPFEASNVPLEGSGASKTLIVHSMVHAPTGRIITFGNAHVPWQARSENTHQYFHIMQRAMQAVPAAIFAGDFNTHPRVFEEALQTLSQSSGQPHEQQDAHAPRAIVHSYTAPDGAANVPPKPTVTQQLQQQQQQTSNSNNNNINAAAAVGVNDDQEATTVVDHAEQQVPEDDKKENKDDDDAVMKQDDDDPAEKPNVNNNNSNVPEAAASAAVGQDSQDAHNDEQQQQQQDEQPPQKPAGTTSSSSSSGTVVPAIINAIPNLKATSLNPRNQPACLDQVWFSSRDKYLSRIPDAPAILVPSDVQDMIRHESVHFAKGDTTGSVPPPPDFTWYFSDHGIVVADFQVTRAPEWPEKRGLLHPLLAATEAVEMGRPTPLATDLNSRVLGE